MKADPLAWATRAVGEAEMLPFPSGRLPSYFLQVPSSEMLPSDWASPPVSLKT